MPIAPFRIGQAAPARADAPPLGRPSPLRIDRRTQRDLARGKRRPEAVIDLHGMTLAQAHVALSRFVLASFSRGCRLILIITGKGGRLRGKAWDQQDGALRREVPEWLSAASLAPLVQEVVPAHRSHGGAGALYVVLRRR